MTKKFRQEKFIVEIFLGGDAFSDHDTAIVEELSTILRGVADRLEKSGIPEQLLCDSNGKPAGSTFVKKYRIRKRKTEGST